jgi:DNA-binding MurR/RpiR family transcriptional regulator
MSALRAPIIVKDKNGSIKQTFDSTLDEATVTKVVQMLERAHPGCTVDTSQVKLARDAHRHLMTLGRVPDYDA